MKKKYRGVIAVFAVVSIIYVLPVLAVAVNSFKKNTYVKTETFSLPTEESFAGTDNTNGCSR